MPQATKKKPAKKPATKARTATVKKPAARSVSKKAVSPANKKPATQTLDRSAWLVVAWFILIAIFLGMVLERYVIG